MLPSPMPPTLFVHMPRDTYTAANVQKCLRRLRTRGAQIEVKPQAITAALFSTKIHGLSERVAAQLVDALRNAHMLDSEGFLADDPRGSAWRNAVRSTPGLLAALPGVTAAEHDSLVADQSPVSEVRPPLPTACVSCLCR